MRHCVVGFGDDPFDFPTMTPLLPQFLAWHQVLTGVWVG